LADPPEVGGILEDAGVQVNVFAGNRHGSLVTESSKFEKSRVILFSLSGGLANALNVVLGPLILRKAGLSGYGMLGLALFVFSMLATFSEFGIQAHLLALYAKGGDAARRGIRDCLYLKAFLIIAALALFGLYHAYYPHPPLVKSLVGRYLLALVFSTMHLEWYFNASGRIARLMVSRALVTVTYSVLVVGWYFSPLDLGSLAWAAGVSQVLGTAVLLKGFHPARRLAALGPPSWQGITTVFARLSPLAATQVISPFFLGAGLFLMDRLGHPPDLIGAYSISNRLALGVLAFILPVILYIIPRAGGMTGPRMPPLRVLGLAALPVPLVAAGGALVIWLFYHLSGRGGEHLGYSLRAFWVLIIGLYLNLARVPFVSRVVAAGRYRGYFLFHLIACAPVLFVAAWPHVPISPEGIPWLVCVPEAIVTIMMMAGAPAVIQA
jgi:O-antigen/teichoic acid export membrane protein